MSIKEIKDKDNLQVVPFSATSDIKLKHIKLPLMDNTSFFYILNGKPRSGKTSCLLTLITNKKAYKKCFNKIIVISPSMMTIKNSPLLKLPKKQLFNRLTFENLETICEEIRGSGDKVLLILDDCASKMKQGEIQEMMLDLIFNRRHYTNDGETGSLSIIISTQVYNKIPLDIRKCADVLFSWRSLNKKENKFIKEEYLSSIPDDKIDEVYKYVYKKPHDCLQIVLNEDLENLLYRNFNKLIWN